MGMLRDLLHGGKPPETVERTLYRAIIAKGREPHWYVEGGVPDTIDGRFAAITGVLCMVLLRLEQEPDKTQESVCLTEIFVDDMDGQLREIGVGDLVVGKHMGRMMGALGGRLGAYRDALAAGDEQVFHDAVKRNFYDEAPAATALAHSSDALLGFYQHLTALDIADIMAARI